MSIKRILKDVIGIEKLLDDYYILVYKNGFAAQRILNETEILTKEEIIQDLQTLSVRSTSDIESFKNFVCRTEKQREFENRNLMDLVRETKYALSRLKRFGIEDAKVKELFKIMKSSISDFKEILNQYIDRSDFKVYDWATALNRSTEEEKLLEEDFKDILN